MWRKDSVFLLVKPFSNKVYGKFCGIPFLESANPQLITHILTSTGKEK